MSNRKSANLTIVSGITLNLMMEYARYRICNQRLFIYYLQGSAKLYANFSTDALTVGAKEVPCAWKVRSIGMHGAVKAPIEIDRRAAPSREQAMLKRRSC